MIEPHAQKWILLGHIASAHGIRGEVMVRSFTEDPAAIASYGPLRDKTGANPLALKIIRVTDKGIVARIVGVSDRTAAEALRGRELYIARDQLPKAGANEFYHADLIGLRALTASGDDYGYVCAVHNFGAGDLLEIALVEKKDTEYIPFTDACVPDVNLAARTLTIVPPTMTGDPEPKDDEEIAPEDF